MNKKIRLWASILAVIVSLGLYLTASEKTYSDQTIKTYQISYRHMWLVFSKKTRLQQIL